MDVEETDLQQKIRGLKLHYESLKVRIKILEKLQKVQKNEQKTAELEPIKKKKRKQRQELTTDSGATSSAPPTRKEKKAVKTPKTELKSTGEDADQVKRKRSTKSRKEETSAPDAQESLRADADTMSDELPLVLG